ncbi:hypothetical protein B0H21DRAFT_41100 [Amylocystis lapponica]|nr:hypothetical protein B0H21DRAFT_41100 [Amylocystis lapponica]
MYASAFITAILAATSAAARAIPQAVQSSQRQQAAAYYNPASGGGSMLDDAGDGYGEPLNVIISGWSSSGVLNEDGLINWARSIGFSEECFDIHLGGPQSANLGDGNGSVNQTVELRQDYGNSGIGTCAESLIGGNHFRLWFQNGPSADSGAAFLAVSKEEPVSEHHDIVPNGYDIGRDDLVSAALGSTSFNGVNYSTTVQNITGLLSAGSSGINHGMLTPLIGHMHHSLCSADIAIDGTVALLEITIE